MTGTTASASLALPDAFGPDDALFTVGPGEMYWIDVTNGTFGPMTEDVFFETPNYVFVGVDPMAGTDASFFSDTSVIDFKGALPKPFFLSNFSSFFGSDPSSDLFAFPFSTPLGPDDYFDTKYELPETVKYLPGGSIAFDAFADCECEKAWSISGSLLRHDSFEVNTEPFFEYGVIADTTGVWYSDSTVEPTQPRGYVGFARYVDGFDDDPELTHYGYFDVSYNTQVHTVTLHGFGFEPIPEAGTGAAAAIVLLGGSAALYGRRRRRDLEGSQAC